MFTKSLSFSQELDLLAVFSFYTKRTIPNNGLNKDYTPPKRKPFLRPAVYKIKEHFKSYNVRKDCKSCSLRSFQLYRKGRDEVFLV